MAKTSLIGLFCDVDDVLTVAPVNMQLARMLGVQDELTEIERRFYQDGSTNSFNRDFIPLFRGAGFSKRKAEESFCQVELRNRATELLGIPGVDTHLVTSGPSFYLDLLASRHNLDIDRRCKCTRYNFDSEGILASDGWVAAGIAAKRDFVRRHARDYAITVGIGNHALLDGPFLSVCTIPILIGEVEQGYLSVNELDTVIEMITRLAEWSLDKQ